MRVSRLLVIITSLALLSVPAVGQVATGTYPFGSFNGSPDSVNLGNLNASWVIPVVNKAGRGTNFVYNLNYSSSVWYPVGSSGSQSWQPVANWGWQGLSSTGISYISYALTSSGGTCGYQGSGNYQEWSYSNIVYSDGNGVSHYFGATAGGVYIHSSTPTDCPATGPVPATQTAYTAMDGSGLTAEVTIGTPGISIYIVTKQGATVNAPLMQNYVPQGGTYLSIDGDGNEISGNSNDVYTDTLGQQALSVVGAAPSNTTLNYTNPVGSTVSYTVSYKPYNIKTNFNCQGITEYTASAVNLVDKVELPDGRFYQFEYEATPNESNYYTGRPVSVTLPTGGTITYQYTGGIGTPAGSGGVNGIVCADGSTSGLTRQTPDGTWTYARTPSGAQWTTKVTEPSYNGTANQFVSNFLTNGAATDANFYEIERQLYAGSASSGTLLETILTCYEAVDTNCSTTIGDNGTNLPGSATSPINRIKTTNQWPNSSGISAGTLDLFDSYGNNTSHEIHDYASGGTYGSNPLEKITTTYSTTYDLDGGELPSEVQVLDASSSVISDTKYGYSMTVVATSGTPQQVKAISVGNLSSVQRLVSGSTWQTSSYTYFDTGNLDVATDVNGGTTTYTYGACGNSFPTSVVSQTGGIVVSSLTTGATWNCVGGVPLTTVDANSNTTTYAYGSDPYWRPVSVTNNATGAETTYSYPTTSPGGTSEVAMNFNGSASTNTAVTTYDTSGRPLLQQTQQSPSSSTYDTIATAYDSLGRVATQTLPYSGILGDNVPTNPGTTTTYDPLNRVTKIADSGGGTKTYVYTQNDVLVTVGPQVTSPSTENLKERNLEYNGAGWLTSVCEVVTSTLPAGGACGQTSSYTGYLTQYTYDAGRLKIVQQNAQSSGVQTRTVAYDDLGRKTSETIPEWSNGSGTAGTTTYTYDSASACTGTSTGDLIETVDNIGNATCFTYDLLHRPTSSQVVSGSYKSVTPLTYAVYDAATYSGTSMQNAKGQVAEAYTCSTSACSSKLTDIFFSATPVTTGTMAGGVESQIWEATPHSSNYFLTQDTFFPNGSVGAISASLGGSSIGIPSLTFGVDGEGRPYSATDGTHSLNLVTATTYNSASSPLSITYGNASTGSANDVDSFSYDPNTYRPTNLTYAINPTSSPYTVTTALTWNANWSLQKMVYTDGSPSPLSQTCTYTADDLSRIASTNCGSTTWQQNFTYDPFGNITKTLPGSAPGTPYPAAYSAVTNQVSSGPTPMPTYDKNGNQLTSTPATLTWNALNQPITVNSTSATYDAMGRMVEKGVSGTYTQFVYRPSGTMLAVYSGSLTKGTIPLPGGSTAIYNASGLSYIRHKDWLGSSRLATTWGHTVYSKEAYAPFGETYNEAGTTIDRSFTGQDQNVVTGSGGTGVYDYLFRKYDPSAGRWLSPDPAGWTAVGLLDPQSLNRYAYVENRPMSSIDPDGLACVYIDSGGNVSVDNDSEAAWTSGLCAFYGGNYVDGKVDPNAIGSVYGPGGGFSSGDGPTVDFTYGGNNAVFGGQIYQGDLSDSSVWLNSAYQISGYWALDTLFVPVEGIPVPIASAGLTLNLTFIQETNTWCVGPAVTVATGTGKTFQATMFPSYSAQASKDAMGGYGWTFGGQPVQLAGLSVATNTSGTTMGYTIATDAGASASYGYNFCADF